jgi:two-component system, cell cycle sensor histidine kinase and response regulator CckA
MTGSQPKRVLIAEDDAAIHALIQAMVTQSGHAVIGNAYNGSEAVHMVRDLRPDALLLDLVMPDPETGRDDRQAGLQAAREIMSTCPVPIVLLTAHDSADLVQQTSLAGVGAYLVKPPRQGEMDRAIMIACARFADLTELRRLNEALQASIIERERAEARIRQLEKMEAISHLAGGIAHQFNNILAAVMLNLKMLQMSNAGIECQESFLEIGSLSERSADLVRQLLAFSRQTVMCPRPIDLSNLPSRIAGLLRHWLPDNIRCVTAEVPPPAFVNADPALIERAVLDLCMNARDAMPEGGTLRIEAGKRMVDEAHAAGIPEARTGEFVCLTIADTGRGMTAPVMKRIFEPFFTTKDVGQGIGLGLATVYGIVGQHKGWVEVESAAGRGTAFRIFMPAFQEPEGTATETSPSAMPGGHEMIFLVEEEPSLRRAVSQFLRRQGYAVLEAGCGDEALAGWRQERHRISLLLSDQIMPDIHGPQLAELFLRDKPELKVILSSGYNIGVSETKLESGATVLSIPKTIAPADLVAIVRSCLDGTPCV